MRTSFTTIFTAALVALCTHCEAVPDIRFVDDAGEHDAAKDSATDGRTDASGTGDAGACTGAEPAFGAVCCGTVWCVDQCDPQNCLRCEAERCQAGTVCCGKNGNVQCKDKCP